MLHVPSASSEALNQQFRPVQLSIAFLGCYPTQKHRHMTRPCENCPGSLFSGEFGCLRMTCDCCSCHTAPRADPGESEVRDEAKQPGKWLSQEKHLLCKPDPSTHTQRWKKGTGVTRSSPGHHVCSHLHTQSY